MIGKTLGHYRIVDKLGEGGMGVVYRAEDLTLKRQVALKVLPDEVCCSERRLKRFQREAEALAALDHPNIVTIHTVEEAEGVHFFTMQLVEGRQLSSLPNEVQIENVSIHVVWSSQLGAKEKHAAGAAGLMMDADRFAQKAIEMSSR